MVWENLSSEAAEVDSAGIALKIPLYMEYSFFYYYFIELHVKNH